ncbi:MAG: glycosyltransferase [Caulobacteraceae bacterium]
MYKLECPIAESAWRDIAEPPVLSIVVPTFNRTGELVVAVSSIAGQLVGGLERKVEIIISDNASEPATVEVIKALFERFPTVSYLIHARDEGGFFQFFAAPWRARGRWTWVFGSDDAVTGGGIAHVVDLLEREQPGFMTLNKQVANSSLTHVLSASANHVPDRRFDTYIDLFCALGINQFAFISGNIERTEAARAIDARYYFAAETRHSHLAAYLEKHAKAPAYYCSANNLVHRTDNSQMIEYNSGNFFDYGVTLPCVLTEVAARIGAPVDLLERISGDKAIESYDAPNLTYVDMMFENILRAIAFGKYMTLAHRYKLERILDACRPHRRAQFLEIWTRHQHLLSLESASARAKSVLDLEQQAALQASQAFARLP